MFNYVFEDIKCDGNFECDDILMVGDIFYIDILGGNKFGVSMVLVLFGNICV